MAVDLMRRISQSTHWTRYFFYRAERVRTTWKLRLGALAFVIFAIWLTRGWWSTVVASGLVCEPNAAPSDAILVENFDSDYLVFERAADLRRAKLAGRVLVPVPAERSSEPSDVAVAVSRVMIDISRLGPVDFVPVRETEPVSLNAARDILRFLEGQHIRSVIVVAPLFRSRRSTLVYSTTFVPAGITVTCEPARSVHRVETWTRTWHGVQDIAEQWLKLQYYRFYVFPWLG